MMGVPHDKELRGVIPRLTDHLFERVNDIVEKTGERAASTVQMVCVSHSRKTDDVFEINNRAREGG